LVAATRTNSPLARELKRITFATSKLIAGQENQ
jgi:hypothetical protein